MNSIVPLPLKRFSTYIKQHRFWIIIIAAIIVIVILGYIYSWGWVGVVPYRLIVDQELKDSQRQKTFWDWLNLAIIPAILFIGAHYLAKEQAKVEREIAKDKRQQEALQYYFDRMTGLLLDYFQDNVDTNTNEKRKTIADIARWQTLTVLRTIDGRRKGQVLSFLCKRGLISVENPIVDLRHAELMGTDLIVGHPYHWGKRQGNGEWDDKILSEYFRHNQGNSRWMADLKEVNLSETDLFKAAFVLTNLEKANLSGAYMVGASLIGANLCGTDLTGADLRGADLKGAVYDEKTHLPDGFDLSAYGAVLKRDSEGT